MNVFHCVSGSDSIIATMSSGSNFDVSETAMEQENAEHDMVTANDQINVENGFSSSSSEHEITHDPSLVPPNSQDSSNISPTVQVLQADYTLFGTRNDVLMLDNQMSTPVMSQTNSQVSPVTQLTHNTVNNNKIGNDRESLSLDDKLNFLIQQSLEQKKDFNTMKQKFDKQERDFNTRFDKQDRVFAKQEQDLANISQSLVVQRQELNAVIQTFETKLTKIEQDQSILATSLNEHSKAFSTQIADLNQRVDNVVKNSETIAHNNTEIKVTLGDITKQQESLKIDQTKIAETVTRVENDVVNLQTTYDQVKENLTTISTDIALLKLSQKALDQEVEFLKDATSENTLRELDSKIQRKIEEHLREHISVGYNPRPLNPDNVEIHSSGVDNVNDLHNPTENANMGQNFVNSQMHSTHDVGMTVPIQNVACNSNRTDRNVNTPIVQTASSPYMSSAANHMCNSSAPPAFMSYLFEESMIRYKQFQIFTNDLKRVHPVVFIRSFRSVFPSNWTERQKINFVIGYIQGDPGMWATDIADRCSDYFQFEQAFLSRFWSPTVQERFRRQIACPEPFDPKKGNLRKYFEKYIAKARYLTKPIEETEILKSVSAKLPTSIREKLATARDTDLDSFFMAVDNLDTIHEDVRAKQRNSNNNSNGNNNAQFSTVPGQNCMSPGNSNNTQPNFQGNNTSWNSGNNNGNTQNSFRHKKKNFNKRFNPGYQNHGNNFNNSGQNQWGQGNMNSAQPNSGNFNQNNNSNWGTQNNASNANIDTNWRAREPIINAIEVTPTNINEQNNTVIGNPVN